MQIGIIKSGEPALDLIEIVGSHSALLERVLGSRFKYREFDALKGELPDSESDAEAFIITGSISSAYHDEPWIHRLREWLIALDPRRPVVGICFGHQIMAMAYGGGVERYAGGMGVGLHEYEVVERAPWMDDARRIVLPVSHHDQVVARPPKARVIATSAFCPYAILSYTDRAALGIQAHPEFPRDLTRMIIDRQEKKGRVDAVRAAEARHSLQKTDDSARVVGWITSFMFPGLTNHAA